MKIKEVPKKDGKVQVYKNGKLVWIDEKDYVDDNLLYHSMIHVLLVLSDKLDTLEDKGYLFQNLKRQANLFRTEFFKHTSAQINLMSQMGSAAFHNHTQKDFDFVLDFISKSKPAQITMLSKLIKENESLLSIGEKELAEKIEKGEIHIEPENEGKSGMFKNKCEHKWVSQGSDETYEFFECEICGNKTEVKHSEPYDGE